MRSCLICDDHPLVQMALADMMGRILPDATLLQARDFSQGQAMMAEHRPALCLSDLHMPGAAPLPGIAALQTAAPATPILIVSGSDEGGLLLPLLHQGVAGFLDKTADLPVAEAAVHLVLSGGRYLPPRILSLMAGAVAANDAPAPPPGISQRQAEVLDLLATGMGNKDIARALNLAPSTVKTHLEESMRRLGASNRLQAARVWQQMRASA